MKHLPLIPLDKTIIEDLLTFKKINLEVFETLASTNDYFKSLPISDKIRVCLTEQQTKGRGRFNREWHSPFGQNIYLSLSYTFAKDLSELAGLSLVTSLAIAKTLDSLCQHADPMLIKWPNDIIYQGEKLAGSLIEVQAETNGFCHVIIGIGINVNMINDSQTISQAWTSLRKIDQQYHDRNLVVATLINNLLPYLAEFATHGLASFIPEWQTRDALLNTKIGVQCGKEKIIGTALGINAQGHLLLQPEHTKETMIFSSGDTSILK